MTSRPLLRSLRRGHALLGVLLVALTVGPSLAGAQESPEELREERRQIQEEAAANAETVSALTEDIEALTEALEALGAAVDGEQAALDAANRRVDAAEVAQHQAEAAITELNTRSAETTQLLRESILNSFIGHQGKNSDAAVLDANPWQFARTEALVEFGNGSTADIIDELRTVEAELERKREDAALAAAELEEQRDEVAARKAELQAAVDREEAVLTEVEARLDAHLIEAAALEELDADLANQIRAEEQRIADAIARRNRDRPVTIPDNAPVDLTVVRGITVNSLIADNVNGFLAAMEARGYPLGGGGYRSSDSQIRLRREHCGTSDYAIWEMPAYQCSPPTARPGRSAHEQGLAIDFTYQGRIIRSRNSDVFRVMSELAGSYGLFNLPSEPWHWSTTGG